MRSLHVNMLKQILVITGVLLCCCHRGLSASLEDGNDLARSMCGWDGERCKENKETDEYSEFSDAEDVDGGTEFISDRNGGRETNRDSDWKGKDTDEMAANLNIKKTAERTKNWEGQVLDGLMEGVNSDGKKCAL